MNQIPAGIERTEVLVDYKNIDSLAELWNKIAQNLKDQGVDPREIFVQQQQFFMGAHCLIMVLKANGMDVFEKLMDEIGINLIKS